MSELKTKAVNSGDISSQIWQIFEILRDERLPSDKYYFILLLLSLYKDNYLTNFLSHPPEESINLLNESLKVSGKSDSDFYRSILEVYQNIIESINPIVFFSVIKAISKIDKEILANNFAEIFDSLLYRLSKIRGRVAGEFIQPLEISRFIGRLADVSNKTRIYNPFAGLGSFRIFIDGDQEYYGQELNEDTWALGALRIRVHNKSKNSNFSQEDSIENWPPDNLKFDLIVSNPPIGLKLPLKNKGLYLNYRTIEPFLIEKGIKSLKEKGRLISVFSQGFLFRGGREQRLRKYLVDSDLIDTIISLPGGLLLNTGIPLIILIVNKAKNMSGKIRLINALDFVELNNVGDKILNDSAIYSIINSKEEADFLRIVSNEQIKKFDYNLNIGRYFQKEYDGVLFSELVDIVQGSRESLPKVGKFVRIRDLNDDKVDNNLRLKKIKNTGIKAPIKKIEESCLLVATRWKSLKPTYFKYEGTPLFIGSDIIALKPNSNKVDVNYLINELHGEYISEQIEALRIGAPIPFIRLKDLLSIKVKLLPVKEQKAKVDGLRILTDKIMELQHERNALAHGVLNAQFNEFASLKHTLGAPRQNILSAAKSLEGFFEKNQSSSHKEVEKSFYKHYGLNLIDVLKGIKSDINYIGEVLEKGEHGLILKNYPLNVISFEEINKTILKLNDSEFKFTIKKYLIEGGKLKDQGIDGNLTLLKILLNNILSNAQKHGFSKNSESNEVVIDLQTIDDSLIMEIKNNGSPFPKNFDKFKFRTKFSTADSSRGSGLGGYDINRISEYFGDNKWQLILNEDKIYPVKFKFQFRLKSIK